MTKYKPEHTSKRITFNRTLPTRCPLESAINSCGLRKNFRCQSRLALAHRLTSRSLGLSNAVFTMSSVRRLRDLGTADCKITISLFLCSTQNLYHSLYSKLNTKHLTINVRFDWLKIRVLKYRPATIQSNHFSQFGWSECHLQRSSTTNQMHLLNSTLCQRIQRIVCNVRVLKLLQHKRDTLHRCLRRQFKHITGKREHNTCKTWSGDSSIRAQSIATFPWPMMTTVSHDRSGDSCNKKAAISFALTLVIQ